MVKRTIVYLVFASLSFISVFLCIPLVKRGLVQQNPLEYWGGVAGLSVSMACFVIFLYRQTINQFLATVSPEVEISCAWATIMTGAFSTTLTFIVLVTEKDLSGAVVLAPVCTVLFLSGIGILFHGRRRKRQQKGK